MLQPLHPWVFVQRSCHRADFVSAVSRVRRSKIARIAAALTTSALLFGAGCKREEQIGIYTAPKEAPAAAPTLAADMSGAAAGALPVSDSGIAGRLNWTVPSGWRLVNVPDNPRFKPVAAFSVSPDHPELLMTVSLLPGSPGARSVYANVVRWAGQLKIAPPAEADLDKYAAHVDVSCGSLDVVTLGGASAADPELLGAILAHNDDTWVFKLAGDPTVVNAQSGVMADFLRSIRFDGAPAPEASSALPATAGPSSPDPTPTSNNAIAGIAGATWTLPAGWGASGGSGTLRLATIRPSRNSPVEVKVTKLRSVGGGTGLNVSRWRGEVGLPPVDDEHADAGQGVDLGSQHWTIHDYSGPANNGSREIIATAMASGDAWYFKLVGPTDAVSAAKPLFDQFLASIKFQ